MSKRFKIAIISLWVVLICVLVGYGLRPDDNTYHQASYASEDDVVVVTGRAVDMQAASGVSAVISEVKVSDTEVIEGSHIDTDVRHVSKTSVKKNNKSPNDEKRTAVPEKTPDVKPEPKTTASPKPTDKPTYTFTIECKRILDKEELWIDGLYEVIPDNGVYYHGTRPYRSGMTVYDELKNICRENQILLDSRFTPLYDTYYVSGIGGLYEFDCGSESGWKYSVNGYLPGIGSSGYTIEAGDEVIFFYDYVI